MERPSQPSQINRQHPIDLTRLEVSWKDKKAAWGFTSGGRPFWGYKLGLVVNGDGVPLAMRLRKANTNENTTSLPLLGDSRDRLAETDRLRDCEYIAADKAYDAEKNFRLTQRRMGALFVCPGKRRKKDKVKRPYTRAYQARVIYPYRTRGVAFAHTDEGKRIFANRTEVERVNGQLKDAQFRVGDIPRSVRGVRRVTRWCLGKVIYFTLACCANYEKKNYTRSFKVYAA